MTMFILIHYIEIVPFRKGSEPFLKFQSIAFVLVHQRVESYLADVESIPVREQRRKI